MMDSEAFSKRALADIGYKAEQVANKYAISIDQATAILIDGVQLGLTIAQRAAAEVEEHWRQKKTFKA